VIHCWFVFGVSHKQRSNAVKYTRTGSITIACSWTKERGNDQEWVWFLCRDTGPGIPKGEQQNMFNRFTTRGGAPGSGLGLSIAKQFVDLMGGWIRFESDPTVKPGTDCVVCLPLKPCDAMITSQPSFIKKADTATPGVGSGASILFKASSTQEAMAQAAAGADMIEEPLRILLTDDISMNRTMLKRRFQKCIAPNGIIVEAATGEATLKICETQEFDVIVMDQYMQEAGGVMTGVDTIVALRRSKVDAVVVGCSGNDLDDAFLSAGAELTWKKPIPPNDVVVQSLRQCLQAKGKL
jgi:two-component system, NarL family, sensor histidine kinase EvgS